MWSIQMELARLIFLLLAISTGIFGQEAKTASDDEENHCPKQYNCVPFSQCKHLDRKAVTYPCLVGGKVMVCCPEGGKVDIDPVPRSSSFPEKCGKTPLTDKIIGGQTAALGQFPFMALLGYTQKKVPFAQYLCGGSIITTKYILTAAHCLDIDPNLKVTTVRVGEHNLTSPIDCEDEALGEKSCADPPVDLEVEKLIPHPDYNTEKLKNDIALVKIKGAMTFTDFVQPICLPFEKKLQTKSLENSAFEVSGWGKTNTATLGGSNVLQYARVKVWNIFRCNNAVPPESQPLQNTQLCANGPKAEDACKGDSGGPLFNQTLDGTKQRIYQIGIVSFGAARACGNRELPTIYTRVDGYLQWIVDNVK